MTAAFRSPLDDLRARWDAHADADALRFAHPASAGDPEAFLTSGARLVERRVAPPAPGGETRPRALDLGCGPGRLLAPLADHFEVDAVDISPRMIAQAAERVGAQPNLHLHVGDGMTLQRVRKHAFDLVLAVDLFAHLPTERVPTYLLRQIGYRLAAGGVLQLTHRADGAADIDRWLAHTGLVVQSQEPDAEDPSTAWWTVVRQTAGRDDAAG